MKFYLLMILWFFSFYGFAGPCEEVAFSDPESFAKAMTEGLILREGQDSLMELYIKGKTPYPNQGEGRTLQEVLSALNFHPELTKPPLREQILELALIKRDSPESLKNFIHSQIKSAGKIRNNLFQVEANLGYWMTMLDFTPAGKFREKASPQLSKEEKKARSQQEQKDFIAWLNTTPLDQKTRDFIKDTSHSYWERAVTLYQALEKIRGLDLGLWPDSFRAEAVSQAEINQTGFVQGSALETADPSRVDKELKTSNKNSITAQAVYRISQAMAELVHTVGFGNKDNIALLKSPDSSQSYEALHKILNEKDLLAFNLGFDGHFKELKDSLGAKIHEESLVLKQIEADIQNQPHIIIGKEVLRLRALSGQESPFRACFGGDCATSSYFEKALDPNFLYFTLTDRQYRSFGQVTVVLGRATNEQGQTIKVGFVDKIQGVSPERLKAMLEGIRLTLKESGYVIALPKEVGRSEGLSNEARISSYVESEILPNQTDSLKDFEPHKHKYDDLFYHGASRANDKLDLWQLEGINQTDKWKIQPGEIHQPKFLMRDVHVQTLYEPVLSLKNSRNAEEQIKFLDNLIILSQIKELGLSESDVRGHLMFVLKDKSFSFLVRKKAFFTLIEFDMQKSQVPHFWPIVPRKTDYFLGYFSDKEITALAGEMSNWKNTSGYRRDFIKNLKYNIQNEETFLTVIKSLSTLWGKIWDINILLVEAVGRGYEDSVNKLLDRGADPNATNDFQDTALIVAVSQRYKKLVQILLDRGADPNATNDFGNTALIASITNKSYEIFQILLDRGADPNITNDLGHTALILAVETAIFENRSSEIVQALLDKGADPNKTKTNGQSPLMLAVRSKKNQIIHILLKNGADPTI